MMQCNAHLETTVRVMVAFTEWYCNIAIEHEPFQKLACMHSRKRSATSEGAKHLICERDAFQIHFVPRDSAGLVSKNVRHLSNLLAEVGRPTTCRCVGFGAVHLGVSVDVPGRTT